MKMVQMEKLKYDDFNAMCLQEVCIRSNSVTIFNIWQNMTVSMYMTQF